MEPIVYILLFGAMLFLIIRAFRATNMWKGAYAENKVARQLARLPKEYYVFNNVYIRKGNQSIQIDHVVISRYGVFVIETKNYKDWVYGSANAEHWTQNIYGHKYQLYNPTRQNASHVSALCNLFNITREKTIPIIVFAGSATVHCSTDCHVIYLNQLRRVIDRHKNIQFSDEQVIQMTGKLSDALVTGKKRKHKHVNEVRQKIAEKERLETKGICPRCHGQLVLRKGQYGQFIGCSNYPNCKYTAHI